MDGTGATSKELSSENATKVDSSVGNMQKKKAIQVTKWDCQDSDSEEEADDSSKFEDDDYESKLSSIFSSMSIETSPSTASICSTESNESIYKTLEEDIGNTLPQGDSNEEREGQNESGYNGNENTDRSLVQSGSDEGEDEEGDGQNGSDCDGSSSSDTLDAGSDLEEEGEQSFSTDRGGGDADLNLDSDPSSQIIKVSITNKKILERDPEAYKKWLKAKNEEIRKNREKEMLAKRTLQRQKELEEKQRKEEREKKIQEWMERKKHDAKKTTHTAKDKNHDQDSSSEHLHCNPDAKFNSWLLNVRKRDEEKRLRSQTVKQLEKSIQQEKKKMSEEIYQEWLKGAKNKPKPVPLNQGPQTLRGTVSNIFINPEPWKSNCED